jgi:hypothetical protein
MVRIDGGDRGQITLLAGANDGYGLHGWLGGEVEE